MRQPNPEAITWRAPAILAALIAVAAALTALPVAQLVRWAAAVALLWLLPATSWAYHLQSTDVNAAPATSGGWTRRPGWVESAVSGLGLAFVASGLATLLFHLLPGPFPRSAAGLVYALLAVAPLALADRRALPTRSGLNRSAWVGVAAVLLIAGLARLPNLGYSEFQGDEAVIMARAAEALAGDDGELFLHQKGPVEILVPMSLWALTETVTEWQVRLPFAVAGLLAVAVIAALAARRFDPQAGLFAGLLAAISGFLVAFSRIVQYQNVVVAMGGLCLLWLLRYRETRRRRDLALGALFMAYGLLAHYDAVLVAPAALWVLVSAWVRWRSRDRQPWRKLWLDLLVAVGVGALSLALFYLPFVLNPMFSRTFSYLTEGRLGGGSLLHNSLVSVWRMSTFYNSVYYVVGLGLLVATAALLRLGSPAMWLYAGVPFLFYAFVVIDPRTHVYTFYPGMTVLAGAALSCLRRWVTRWRPSLSRGWTWVMAGFLGLWYALSTGYIGLAFVQHQVEYKRRWPESRHPLYPVPFPEDALPPYGHFGFPYRAGWKAVDVLYAQGLLEGTYASNEEPEVTTWYVRNGARTMCDHPDYFVVAAHVQDEIPLDQAILTRDYLPILRIMVGNDPKIVVYARTSRAAPVNKTDPILTLDAADYAATYDAGTAVAMHLPNLQVGDHQVDADFGAVARLLGYDLPQRVIRRGEALYLTLYWRALTSPVRNYQVFSHVVAAGELVAQDDSAPACAHAPTSLWEYGEVIRDEHLIPIDETVPLGPVALNVGMYDLLTLDRLPVNGGPTESLYLTELEVIE